MASKRFLKPSTLYTYKKCLQKYQYDVHPTKISRHNVKSAYHEEHCHSIYVHVYIDDFIYTEMWRRSGRLESSSKYVDTMKAIVSYLLKEIKPKASKSTL